MSEGLKPGVPRKQRVGKKPSTRESAGTVLYRPAAGGVEILLVHPSGWYNKSAPWSIPKGIPDAGESTEEAARRETLEETGVVVDGPLKPLGFVLYKGGKRVHAFYAPAPANAKPFCASWEVDRAQFFRVDEARLILHAAQKEFVERLTEQLGLPRATTPNLA